MGLTFLDDGEVRKKLLAVLHKVEFEEPSSWDVIIRHANEAAYDTITSIMLSRGYTLAQISGWHARITYARDLAVYFCLANGGQLENYSDTFLKMLDCRETLKTVDVINVLAIGNNPPQPVIVRPGMRGYRRMGTGKLRNRSDRFTENGPEGGRGRYEDMVRESEREFDVRLGDVGAPWDW